MNMISTGAFLFETDASTKQNELVKKLTAAWEKKNSKTARAGGASLMALSLAACGGEDDTPFSAADVSDAEAAATTAALTAADDTVYASVDAAVTAGADAANEDMIAEINSSLGTSLTTADDAATVISTIQTSNDTALLTDADGVEHATVDAAITSNDTALLTDADGVEHATVDAAITSNDTEVMMSQADYDAAIDAADDDEQATIDSMNTTITNAGFADLDALVAEYNSLANPTGKDVDLQLASAGAEESGSNGDDTFSGIQATAGDTWNATDVLVGLDGDDTFTLTSSEATINAGTTVGIETINIKMNVAGGSAGSLDATNISGVTDLNITREDMGNISGTGAFTVSNIDGGDITNVNAVSGVSSLVVEQQTLDGTTVNATGVTGSVTLHGSGTIVANSAASTATVTVSTADLAAAALGTTGLDGAVNVTTTAGTVTVGSGAGTLTGDVTVNATAATTVNVTTTGASNITADAATLINVDNTDASGTTITSGKAGTSTTPVVIQMDGTTATTDVLTASAIGVVTLDDQGDAIETLNLSGNGAAVTYTIDAGFGATTIAGSGDSAVNLTIAADDLDTNTVSGITTLTTNAVASGAVDLTNVSATNIDFDSRDHAANDFTVGTGINFIVGADQTTGLDLFAAVDNSDITITTKDDDATTAVGTILGRAVDLDNTFDFATVTLDATAAHFTATSFATEDAAVTVQGTRNVDLGTTVTATTINASGLSGTFDMTMGANSANVTGASGVNTIIMNGGAVMTLATGVGADVITVTAVSDGSTVVTGDGADDITLTDAGANSFDLGAGNDTVDVDQDVDIDSVFFFGEGTGDVIEFDSTANIDLADNTNFAMYNVEEVDVTATTGGITISAAQFALDNVFAIDGNATTDILEIEAAATGSVIDASGVTIKSGSTALLTLTGGAAADTITGGASGESINGGDGADTIVGGAGGDTLVITLAADLEAGDSFDGGTGTDLIDYNVASAVDLTVATFTSVEALYTGGQQVTLAQGTGVETVYEYAHGVAGTFILKGGSTNFETSEETGAAAVDIAGEWFLQDETALTDAVLTYYDEGLGAAHTLTLDSTAGGTDDSIAMVGGSLVYTIA